MLLGTLMHSPGPPHPSSPRLTPGPLTRYGDVLQKTRRRLLRFLKPNTSGIQILSCLSTANGFLGAECAQTGDFFFCFFLTVRPAERPAVHRLAGVIRAHMSR